MLYLLMILIALGIVVAIFSLVFRKKGETDEVVRVDSSCGTCLGIDPQCEQECVMEASTKEIEYYADEELDAYRGRPSNGYTDTEAEDFLEILYTMRQEEVKGWNRSLILRGINLPDQIKDEVIMMIEGK
ncbi:hypothetical protein C7120_01335 [Prevotella sp. oral taxon 376]|uniref:hypothetical protein n=1 Tax=Prevotella sp. oral taxon 376 TaxID=712466 RepID=UPI000D1DBF79|nr:hypothetical protein [Prevotella sp. oral taxon 376]PTL33302.1 hypothetical protein C7120_01335 [Prevotella sp. oral taxon 376]